MKTLSEMAQEYISLRRSLGYKLRDAASLLKDFGLFMERNGALYITVKLVLQWAKKPKNVLPSHWSSRLGVVRRFAQYAKAIDLRNEVPPYGLLPHKYRRHKPYIYSDEEVLRLLQACTSLISAGNGLRRHTYYTVFGVLAATGMRISEVTGLSREDVDLTQGIISIRETKFCKSRRIPLHDTTLQVLREYAQLRDQIHPYDRNTRFLLV